MKGIKQTPEGIWVLEHDTHLSRWIEEHKRLDIADGQIAFYAKHIPAGGTVLDAGASLGDHTATYAKLVGPAGRVWAIEPNPLAFHCLQRNFVAHENVHCWNVALGQEWGMVGLKTDDNAGKTRVVGIGRGPMEMITIDSLGAQRLDFVHLDCEGFELRVLRGARKTLAKFRPVIVLEVHHECLALNGESEATLLGLLKDFGYRWEEIEPHHGPANPQRDIICFPL